MQTSRLYSTRFRFIDELFIEAIISRREEFLPILWWLNQRTAVEKFLLKKYAESGRMHSMFPSIEKKLRNLMQSLHDFLRSTGQWY